MAHPGPIQYLSSEDEHPEPTDRPKKRQKLGSKRDSDKLERLHNHVTGPHCRCKRKCTTLMTDVDRQTLIKNFNDLLSKDAQDAYLCGIIRLLPVRRRRMTRGDSIPNESSYKYIVHIVENNVAREQVICYSGFLSLYGITNRRARCVKDSLVRYGVAPKDKRGKHNNRPNKLNDVDRSSVFDHISSFRSRKSHYSRGQHKKVYLSEDLNVKKMFMLYKDKYPNSKASYNLYLKTFNNSFNIAFGYPRCDTCSTCDAFIVKLKDIEAQLNSTADEAGKNTLTLAKKKIKVDHDLHKRRAETFYERKRTSREAAKTKPTNFAFAMDFAKNLPSPNIQTNDVYYKRQLSLYSFNIHVLATKDSYFYCYDETVARKGADEVVSILDNFISTYVPMEVKDLQIFCDSCAGQNKNYTVLRFLHYIVVSKQRFNSVQLTFPIRGHSYMECDKNMGLINQKTHLETPDDWRAHIGKSRSNPMPFVVVNCQKEMFKTYTAFLKPAYKPSCPFPTRPLRDYLVKAEVPTLVYVRENYNGIWDTHTLQKRPLARDPQNRNSFSVPLANAYNDALPLQVAKYNDLQVLSKFCTKHAAIFFKNLPCIGPPPVPSPGGEKVSESEDESDTDY